MERFVLFISEPGSDDIVDIHPSKPAAESALVDYVRARSATILIVLDDLSYVRKDQVETSALFELIAHRYERHSIAITANQQFSAWDNVFPDPAMTVAAIDRLVHHSTIIEMNGESYRKLSAVARINAGDYDPSNGAPGRPS